MYMEKVNIRIRKAKYKILTTYLVNLAAKILYSSKKWMFSEHKESAAP